MEAKTLPEDVPHHSESPLHIVVTGAIGDDALNIFEQSGIACSRADQHEEQPPQQKAVVLEPSVPRALSMLGSTARHMVFLYEAPEHFLAMRLQDGTALGEAIPETIDYATHVLSTFKANRQQVTLLESRALLAKPELAMQALARRADLACDVSNLSKPQSPGEETPSIMSLGALLATHESAELKMLCVELSASSASHISDSSQHLVDRLSALIAETHTATEAAKKLGDGNELLLLQVNQLQAELKNQSIAATRLKSAAQEAAELKKELGEAKHQLQNLRRFEAAHRTIANENAELRIQIGEVAVELDTLRRYEAEHAAAVTQSLDLQRETDCLKLEISDKAELLSHITRDLEQERNEVQSLRETVSGKTEEKKKDEQKISNLRDRVDQAEKRLNITAATLEEHVTALKQMRASISWRITSPMRWLLGLFISSTD